MFRAIHSNKLCAQLSWRLLLSARLESTTANVASAKTKIVLPKPIKREPTDILYALAATVKRDPTAAHYQFVDDPYLIPKSQITKSNYALAMENGRKAAYFVMNENPELFQHNNADPPIKAYQPATVYNENSSVEVKDLENSIELADVADAITIYELLQKNQVDIPNELKQSLLELTAFHNSSNIPEEDQLLNRALVDINPKQKISSWTDGGFADKLFASMDPKTDAAYNAIIRGKAKYNQAVKAYELFEEALKKNVNLDASTFSYVIELAYWLHDSATPRWQMLTEVLQKMSDSHVRPTVQTLNAVLFVTTKVGSYHQVRENCLQVLAEFNRLGVQPSLGTWEYVLACFCRDRAPTSYILHDILDQVENREWHVQTPNDLYFFATAMAVCRNHLNDIQVAKRIHNLFNFGDNYKLIGNAHKETVYYRNYLGVSLDTLPFDDFMQTYETIVPNFHCPESGIMLAILQNIDASGAIQYLPRIYSDMVILNHFRPNLVSKLLNIMAVNAPIAGVEKHEGLREKYGEIAWDIHETIENQPEWRVKKMEWDDQLLSDLLTVFCYANDYNKAELIFQKFGGPKGLKMLASTDSVAHYVRLCVANGKPTSAVNALKYNVDNAGVDKNVELGQLIVTSLTLSEVHLSQVASLIGAEHVNSAQNSVQTNPT